MTSYWLGKKRDKETRLKISIGHKGKILSEETKRGNIDNWKKERTEIFDKYGWSLIFFDETQINEYNILETLKNK